MRRRPRRSQRARAADAPAQGLGRDRDSESATLASAPCVLHICRRPDAICARAGCAGSRAPDGQSAAQASFGEGPMTSGVPRSVVGAHVSRHGLRGAARWQIGVRDDDVPHTYSTYVPPSRRVLRTVRPRAKVSPRSAAARAARETKAKCSAPDAVGCCWGC